ncbi:unnamed protein product [Prunus armeniaca]|uniref:Uncharacterized protein n=1 Tax=Prunus armeniaca TaxID=36596 RepID=A0A6J5YB19_PRUAR|nr:unnamed protein product [Prunus armeniaca]
MMNAGLALQWYDATIQYCALRLQELRNLVASALNEKSRSQVTENLHNIRGRFLADILRVLRHMALDLCKTPLPFLWRKTGPSVTVGRWDPLLESLGLYIRQKFFIACIIECYTSVCDWWNPGYQSCKHFVLNMLGRIIAAMLLQNEGKENKMPHELQKARSMLEETLSILPLDRFSSPSIVSDAENGIRPRHA